MKIEFENRGNRYTCELKSGVSLSKSVQFSASESNPWNVSSPSKHPVKTDGFTGSTRDGGPCNVDQISLVPHCHGTHTETVGHIVDEDYCVSGLSIPSLIPAVVISVAPESATSVKDTYQPVLEDKDEVISSNQIERELEKWRSFASQALIVRSGSDTAFLTNDAMTKIAESGFNHLLVDFPSVDRLDDDGLLSNHRIFWGVETGSRETNQESLVANTITELIDVPDQLNDGPCLLSIQVPSIESDAAPSRPVVYPIARL